MTVASQSTVLGCKTFSTVRFTSFRCLLAKWMFVIFVKIHISVTGTKMAEKYQSPPETNHDILYNFETMWVTFLYTSVAIVILIVKTSKFVSHDKQFEVKVSQNNKQSIPIVVFPCKKNLGQKSTASATFPKIKWWLKKHLANEQWHYVDMFCASAVTNFFALFRGRQRMLQRRVRWKEF